MSQRERTRERMRERERERQTDRQRERESATVYEIKCSAQSKDAAD